jgi:hypothetical protein
MTARNSVHMRLRVLATAAVTAAALALSACAGDAPGGSGTPSTPAPSQSTSAATPSPTASAVYKPADAKGKAQNVPLPVMPEAAKAETKEGLEAFAKYWYALMNYAYETGNLEPVTQVSGPSCASCNRVRDTVVAWNSNGQWIEGGALLVTNATTTFKKDGEGQYQAVIQYHRQAISYHKADGSVEQSSAKTSLLADILIAEFVSGSWSAANVDRIGG